MYCEKSVVTEFVNSTGLAAMSRQKEDPWNGFKLVGEEAKIEAVHGKNNIVMCAPLMGGTPPYFSPEQIWLFRESKKINGADALREFEETFPLTPAVSDLYQVALTMLEAYSRYLPSVGLNLPFTPCDQAARCAARTPESELMAFPPERSEQWLTEKKIEHPLVEGVLVAKGIDGTRLLELSRAKDWKVVKTELGVTKVAQVKKMQMEISRHISTPADDMAFAEIGEVLKKCLSPEVGDRNASVQHVFESLGNTFYTTVLSAALIPEAAFEEFPNHDDTVVESALGGLAKQLVQFDEVEGALSSCAEWWGVASPEARADARGAYLKLWEHHGGGLQHLELSREVHTHWHKDMLRGRDVLQNLATSLSSSAALTLVGIEIVEQPALEGALAETFFDTCKFPNLRFTKFRRCCEDHSGGTIPASIAECESLEVLELAECNFQGIGIMKLYVAQSTSRLAVTTLCCRQREGPLPKQLFSLVNLRELDLTGNKSKGTVTSLRQFKRVAYGINGA